MLHHPYPDDLGRRFRPERPDRADGFDLDGPDGAPGRPDDGPVTGPRGRGHRGRRGPGHGFGPGFGPGGKRGWGGPRPRGDVRAAILLLLAEQPRHGYELIGEITERSEGAWTPSPGSVYPTLQVLEDEGLVRLEKVEGRRTASLTEAGTAWVQENRERLGDPFMVAGPPPGALALRQELGALREAVGQVARVGAAYQLTAAAAALAAARKEIYRLLAEDAAPVDE